jgi:hypothetical protein
MAVSGEGNFSTVTAPRLKSKNGFKIYEPQVKQEDGKKWFEQIIMPMNSEIKEIPAISFDFFNMQTGQYKTIERGPFPVRILKPEKEEETKMVENKQFTPAAIVKEEKLGRVIIYIKDNLVRLKNKNAYL